jgi:hypothetical protein
MRKVLDELEIDRFDTLPSFSLQRLERIERLASSIIEAGRKLAFDKTPDFKLRPLKNSERTLMAKIGVDQNVNGRWVDHVSAADTKLGPMIIAEPYSLTAKDFRAFIELESRGWNVEVHDKLGTYFPANAVCVCLLPPKKAE